MPRTHEKPYSLTSAAMSNNSNRIATGAALVIGGVLLYKLLADDSEHEDEFDGTYNTTQTPTMQPAQARILAERVSLAIYGSSTFWSTWLFGSLIEDEGEVVRSMTDETITNDADVLLVAKEYGVRGAYMTNDYTLFQAIAAYLKPSDREEINEVYRSRNINIRV